MGRSGLPKKFMRHFPGNGSLEGYFHAALHFVCMVLEGDPSTCLVAAKQPSNTVTDPRERSLTVDAQSALLW